MDWKELVRGYTREPGNIEALVNEFVTKNKDWESILRKELHPPRDRIAVYVLQYLPEKHKRQVFDELIFFCTGSMLGDVAIARKAILDMDRDWVNERIWQYMLPELEGAGDPTFEYVLGTLWKLGRSDLVKVVAEMALSHDDPEVRETGERYLT